MTIFEYLSVAISIVFSLAIVRLLNGVHHFTASRSRYWVHVAWVVALGVTIPLVWWNMWAYREMESWVFPEFFLLLLTPVTLYYLASTLIPDTPAAVESWRSHYFRVRRRLFFGFIFLILCFFMNTAVLRQAPILHPLRAAEAASVAIFLVGAFSENPRVHGFLVSLGFCVLAGITFFIFLTPGGWAAL